MNLCYQMRMILKKGIIIFLHLFVMLGVLTSQVYATYASSLKEKSLPCHLSPGSSLDEEKFNDLLIALANSLTSLEKTENGEIIIGNGKLQLTVFENLLKGFSDTHYIDNLNFYGDEKNIYFHSKEPRGSDKSGFLYQVSTINSQPIPNINPVWIRDMGGLKVRIYKRGAEFENFLKSQDLGIYPEKLNLSLLFDETMIVKQIIQTKNSNFAELLMGILKLKGSSFDLSDNDLKVFEDNLISILVNDDVIDNVLETILPDLLSLLQSRLKKDIKSMNTKLARKIITYAVDLDQSSDVRAQAFSIVFDLLSKEYPKSASKNKLNTKVGEYLAKLIFDSGIQIDLRESAIKIILPDVIETYKKTKSGSKMNRQLLDLLTFIGSDATISELFRIQALEVTGDFTFSPLENKDYDKDASSFVLAEGSLHLDGFSISLTEDGSKEEASLEDSYENIILESLSRIRLIGGIDAFPFKIKIVKNSSKLFSLDKKGSNFVITLDSNSFKGFAAFKVPIILLLGKKMLEGGELGLAESYLAFISIFRSLSEIDVFQESMDLGDTNGLNPFLKQLQDVALREDDGADEAILEYIKQSGLSMSDASYQNNIGIVTIINDYYLAEAFLHEGKISGAYDLISSVVTNPDKKNILKVALMQTKDPIILERLNHVVANINDVLLFTKGFEDLKKDYDDILDVPNNVRLSFFSKYAQLFPHIEIISYHLAVCYLEMAEKIEEKKREDSSEFNDYVNSAKSIASDFLKRNKGSYIIHIIFEKAKNLMRGIQQKSVSRLLGTEKPFESSFLNPNIQRESLVPPNSEKPVEFSINDFDGFFRALRSAVRLHSYSKVGAIVSIIFQKLMKISSAGQLAADTQYDVLAKMIEYTTDFGGFSHIHDWFIRVYDNYLLENKLDDANKLSEKYLSWVKKDFNKELYDYMKLLVETRSKQLQIIMNLNDDQFNQDEFEALLNPVMKDFAKIWEIYCANRNDPNFDSLNMVEYYFIDFSWIHYFDAYLVQSNNPLKKIFVEDVLNSLRRRESYLDSELIPIHQNLIDIRLLVKGISSLRNFEGIRDELKDKYLQVFDMTHQKIQEKMKTYTSKKDHNLKVSLAQIVGQIKKSVVENMQRLIRENPSFPGWSELMIEISQDVYKQAKKNHNLRFYQMTMEFLASQVGNRSGWMEPGHDTKAISRLISMYSDTLIKFKSLANNSYEPTFEYIETIYPELETFLAGLHERIASINTDPQVKLDHLKKANDLYEVCLGRDMYVHTAPRSGKKPVKQLEAKLSDAPEKDAKENIARLKGSIDSLEEEVAEINRKKVLVEIEKSGGIPEETENVIKESLEKINMKTLNNGPILVRESLKALDKLRNSEFGNLYEPVIKNGVELILKRVTSIYTSIPRNPKIDAKFYLMFNEIIKIDSKIFYNLLREDSDIGLDIFEFIINSFNLDTGMIQKVLSGKKKVRKANSMKAPISKNIERLDLMIPFLARIAKKDLKTEIVAVFNYLKEQSWLSDNASQELEKAIRSLEKDLFDQQVDAFYKRDRAIFITRTEAMATIDNAEIKDHNEVTSLLEEAEFKHFIKAFGVNGTLLGGGASIPDDRIKFILDSGRDILKSGKEGENNEIYVDANIRKIGNIFINAARFHKEVQKHRDNGFHSYILWNDLLDAVYQVNTEADIKELDLNMFEGAWKGRGGITKWGLAEKKMLGAEVTAMKNNPDFGTTYEGPEWKNIIQEGKAAQINWKEFLVRNVYGVRYLKSPYAILQGDKFDEFINDAVNDALKRYQKPGTTMTLRDFEIMALDYEAELLRDMFQTTSPVERERIDSRIRRSLGYLKDSFAVSEREGETFSVFAARAIYLQEYSNPILRETPEGLHSFRDLIFQLKNFDEFTSENLDRIVTEKEVEYIQTQYPEVPLDIIEKQVGLLKQGDLLREEMAEKLERENQKFVLRTATLRVFEKNPLLKEISDLSPLIKAEVEKLYTDFLEKDLKEEVLPSLEDIISRVEFWYGLESAVYLFAEDNIDLPSTLIAEEMLNQESREMKFSQFKDHLNGFIKILPGSVELYFDREGSFEIGFEIKPNIDLKKLSEFLDSSEGIAKITKILTYAEKDHLLPDSPLIITPDVNEHEEHLRELIKTFNAMYRDTLSFKYDKNKSGIILSIDPSAKIQDLKNIYGKEGKKLIGVEKIVQTAQKLNLKNYRYAQAVGDLKLYEASIQGSLSLALSEISLLDKAKKRATEAVSEKVNRIEVGFDLFSKTILKIIRELFKDKDIEENFGPQVIMDEDANNIPDIFERYLKKEHEKLLADISKRSVEILISSAQKSATSSKKSSEEQVEILSKLAPFLNEGSVFMFLESISNSLGRIITSNAKDEVSKSEFNSNVTYSFLNEVISLLEKAKPIEGIQSIVFPPKSAKISA